MPLIQLPWLSTPIFITPTRDRVGARVACLTQPRLPFHRVQEYHAASSQHEAVINELRPTVRRCKAKANGRPINAKVSQDAEEAARKAEMPRGPKGE